MKEGPDPPAAWMEAVDPGLELDLNPGHVTQVREVRDNIEGLNLLLMCIKEWKYQNEDMENISIESQKTIPLF